MHNVAPRADTDTVAVASHSVCDNEQMSRAMTEACGARARNAHASKHCAIGPTTLAG